MRIIGAPHQGLDANILDQLGADPVELERRPALAPPILARLELHQIAKAILVLEIHPVERVGQPADPAFTETDAQVRVALEHAGPDDRSNDVDQVHLKAGYPSEPRGPLRLTGGHFAGLWRGRREGVEVERELDIVDRFPQRIPDR